MFVTSEPASQAAICGGYVRGRGVTASCLVLDQINQRWGESRMGNLTIERNRGVAATLDRIGVFIVGGEGGARRSNFLAAGTMQWQEGPALPLSSDMTDEPFYPCALTISATSFLVVRGTDIREFDAAIAGPRSNEGWREAGHWPALMSRRIRQPGCAKIGQKVIIAGGYDAGILSSTEVLDLVSRQVASGGEMNQPRMWFHIATIVSGGVEKTFALGGELKSFADGGDNDDKNTTSVEEWVEESSTWKTAASLVDLPTRSAFSLVVIPKRLICPV